MKKLFILFALLILMGVGCEKPLGAFDEENIISAIKTAEDTYFQTHGRYFQVLPTSKEPPNGSQSPDNLDAKPSYQAEKIADLITLPAKLPFSITVNTFVKDKEYGYQILLSKSVDTLITESVASGSGQKIYGVKWNKSIGIGLDSKQNTYDWKN
jgi:hypothetical protein